jgi:hypothetical protein
METNMSKGMRMLSTVAIASFLLLMTGGMAQAEESADPAAEVEAADAAKAATDGVGGPDCTKVFQAKAVADKGMSSVHLSQQLGLPLEKVNECLLMLRRRPRAAE